MNRIRYYFPILLIICISFLVYLNALSDGFVWDDMVLIADNEGIKKWDSFLENFVRDFFDTTDDTIEFKYGYYRPIISLSYMIDYAVWGLEPWGFHLSNIIFHTMSCILVYLIFNSLFNNRSLSIITSLLFACHPIHTESVTWISGRTDIIAGMFFFAAFYLYQKAIHLPLSSEGNGSLRNRKRVKLFPTRSKIFYACSIILFALAMLCKEMVATLPFLIIAYTHYFVGLKNWRQWKTSLPLSIPYFFVILLYGIIRFVILGIHTVDNPGGEEMKGFYPTTLSFAKTIFIYLFKLIYPVHLSAYIQNPMSFSITEPTVFSSVIGVSFLIFLIVWLKKRWAGMSFLILFYLVTLLPLSNFIRISAPWDMGFVTAERFLYIPSLGFCGIISVLLTTAWKTWKRSFPILGYVTILLFIALLIFYSGQTLSRNRDWIDEKTFFSKTLKEAPNAALLHHAMGNVYVREENYEKALEYYHNSLALYPLYHAAYNNIGTIYSKHALYDEAITAFKEAIKINPDYIQSHFNLGTTYYQKGMTEDASREFKIVLAFNKNYVKAHNNLGIIYAEKGLLNEAIAEFEEVLRHEPHNEKARNNLEIIKEELASKSPNKNL